MTKCTWTNSLRYETITTARGMVRMGVLDSPFATTQELSATTCPVDPPTDCPRTARRAWHMFVPPPERWRRFDGQCPAAASHRLAAAEDLFATPP